MEKVSLYKFTHILLLKNYGQLKQKSDQKKKKQSPNLLKNKNHVPKKITSSLKTKQNKTTITPTVQEIQKKEEKKKEGNI